MKKLRRFLLGRKFVLRTDHKPLVGLLDENKVENKRQENLIYKMSEF
jgi:hypothetical protein